MFFNLGLLYAVPTPIEFYDCVQPGEYSGSIFGSSCMPLQPDGTGWVSSSNYRNTMIYNAFVWAQLFNEINARKIYNELNPFEGVLTNAMFVGVVGVSAILQLITVQFIPHGFNTVPLDGDDWAVCLILGLISIPLGVLTRFLPPFDFVNRLGGIGEPKEVPEENVSPALVISLHEIRWLQGFAVNSRAMEVLFSQTINLFA